MNNVASKKINSTLKFVYSDNNSLSVIFQDNDLLMGIVGEFNENLKDQVCIIANSDIILDGTLSVLQNTNLENIFTALTRWEVFFEKT